MIFLAIFLSVVFIVVSIGQFKLHPVLALLLASLGLGFYFGMPGVEIVKTIGSGFGAILSGIGLIVVLGSIIGVALERSGAALMVAESVLQFFGPKRPALAVSLIGALVSIPVFCDSGFILLAGLNRSLARRSGASLGVLSLAMAAGLYTTHTLVPPTPGPIAAAGQLGADAYLGTIMLLGGLVSIPVLLVAYRASLFLGRNLVLDLESSAVEGSREELQSSKVQAEQAKSSNPPNSWLSFAPLLLPIGLIALGTLFNFMAWRGGIGSIFIFIGQPLIALLIGLLPAYLLARQGGYDWNAWVKSAILMSGPILIVTGAGGAFGAILKSSPLAATISEMLGDQPLSLVALLGLAFLIAAILKTAQGSSTNALVITAGMVAPLAVAAGLTSAYEYALLVLAIGGGAMTVSHANDSYFWVVTRFSGITVKDAYRTYTPLTGIMGVTTILIVIMLAYFGSLL